ncbi:hypothetical protein ACFORO_12565 [Amycolatopsis halotolerans]|uniref:Uncharacterized protein n=1 Tax=Amycolatopsis halotolerans TaxID=330083 RepID=A0ABV7QCY1_9PSEU
MAGELEPGVLAQVFLRMSAQAEARGRRVLEPLAIAIENQAKTNASTGSHPYGTKTPARPGAGPAIVSGSLRRAITHTAPVPAAGGWTATVGVAGGVYPPRRPNAGKRGGRSKPTAVSKYAQYLEEGLRNGEKYPFLLPAFRFGVTVAAPTIYTAVFGAGWTTAA